MDSDAVARTIQPIALNSKSAVFTENNTEAENRGVIASLI
jgi:hypothetical protein